MCPNCDEVLIAFEYQGVELDRCPSCGGTWLDAGELRWMIELADAKPGRLTQALQQAAVGPRVDRRCPRCKRRLNRVTIDTTPPVELDRCLWGHGLWFDSGELRAVIKAFVDGEEAVVAHLLSELNQQDLASIPEGGSREY